MSFVHLQVHSGYSLLNSAASVKELVKEAGALGYSSLALTDENVMYGAIEFYKACKANGIKPIIGLTASLYTDESELEACPLVLLAATNAGYQNLLKISSALQSKSKGGIKQKWMKSYHEGLIAITPGEKGYIETLLQAGQFEKAAQTAKEFRELFKEGCFYLGYQPFKGNETLSEEILRLSAETEIAVCATGDVHYIRKEDQDAYRCLCAIKAGEKWADLSGDMPGLHLRSPDEMKELYAGHPEALEASANIAKQCHVDVSLGQTRLPSFPAPNGKSADDYLAEVCFEGLRRRFASPDDRAVRRLEYELDVIRRMRFSDYFLIVWDFMKYAHEQGIVTGPGRGSAAGSLVAYTLFITDVDPLKHSLLFERFLNPERISMPDIDIDFPDTRRDEVIQYVQKKYGSMHVAQIITFGTLAAKAALRDTGRVFGISPKEADQLARLIPSKPGMTLEEARRQSAQLNQRLSESDVLAKVFHIAKKIEGLPRHTSTHAAGVVLSQEPLSEIVPLQEGHEGVYLTQYAMDHLEDLGLLKMDFLGLRNLTLIESIKTMIEKETNTKIDFSGISYQDEKTFTLLSKGDTTGIFQLESSGMRSVLKRLKPSRLEDIVAVNALYRPGPMENIPLFIDRKHGRARVEVPHEDVRSILAETYGVIVYQEQIMMIASRMAGFSLGEADLLRRAVSKKQKDILDRERSHFVEGCLKKEYSVVTANEVYDLIVKFANYGFNRSHAVAYSMIGYQLAYLKAHYPLYFMCGLLTSVIGNEDKISQYLYEAKGSGIEVLPPSVNSSSFPFTVENGAVRYSLRAIKNVGVSAVKDIYKARTHKPFEDLFDFCFRVPAKSMNRKTIEALIFSGAMDEFNQNRATLLASVDVALEHAELFRDDDDQMGLFLEESFSIKPKYVEAEEFPLVDMLRFEKEVLGVYFSNHPLSVFRDGLTARGALSIVQARQMPKGQLSIGALLAGIKTIRTKTGQHMAFLTLSDETGEIEAIVFPDQFRRLSPLLKEGALLYTFGKMEQRQEKTQFILSAAYILEQAGTDKAPSVYIKIEGSRHNQELLAKMKRILLEHKGETGVYLYYEKQKQTIKLPDSFHIQADHQVLYRLKELLGQQNVVLK